MIPFHFLAKLYPFVTERHWNDVACLSGDNRPAIIPIFCHLILRFTATWSVRGMRYILLVVASPKKWTSHSHNYLPCRIKVQENRHSHDTKYWAFSNLQTVQYKSYPHFKSGRIYVLKNLSFLPLTSCLQVVSVALLFVNAVKLKIQIGIKKKLIFLREN